jgi:hypothetical protein
MEVRVTGEIACKLESTEITRTVRKATPDSEASV